MKKTPLLIFIILSIAILYHTGCITNEQPQPNINDDDLPLDLEERSIIFTQSLKGGDYDYIYNEFNETIKESFPIEDLQNAWQSLIINYGTLETIESTFLTEEQGSTVVYVTCNFSTLGLLDIRYAYDTTTKIIGFQFTPYQPRDVWSPPSYANKNTIVETNYSIGQNPYILSGTLTHPVGDGPFPLILMLSGSGPNDRDETIYTNKPFKDIAWGLATQGIATFRFDKRSLIYGSLYAQDINATVEEEYFEDAIYAIDLLSNLSAILDTDQFYVLGHSLGAQITPELARRDNRIQGAILLASPARELKDLFYEQYYYLYILDGKLSTNEQIQLNEIENQVALINNQTAPPTKPILGAYPSYWYYLHTIPPIPIAQNLSIPLLVLQGERDYQVSSTKDFLQWQSTFLNTSRVTLKLYEELNHLFMYGVGPPTNTEYQTPSHVQETVITDIAYWLKNNYQLPPEGD